MHKILLCAGPQRKKIAAISFRYSNSAVTLTLYERGFAARYNQSSRPLGFEFDQRKKEIVKKALLLYLVETGRCNNSYNVSLIADGKKRNEIKFFFLEPLENRQLEPEDRAKLESIILNNPRSKYPLSVICYINYALGGAAKVSDSFRYLFQGFNTFFSNIEMNGRSAKQIRSEAEKLNLIRELFFVESGLPILDRKKSNVLCQNLDLSNKELIIHEVNKRIRINAIEGGLITDADAFVLLVYSYYLRCKLFHGEAPFPLVSSDGDVELTNLAECNRVLEGFLKKHIHLLIDKDYFGPGEAS